MHVEVVLVVTLLSLSFIQCLDEVPIIVSQRDCQRSVLQGSNSKDIVHELGESNVSNGQENGENKNSDVSIILVSKFHTRSYNVELVPKFKEHISSITGLLLHSAISENRSDIFEALVNFGASVEISNRLGITPLYKAIKNAQDGMTNTLLKCGADPNFSWSNFSLVHNAASEGNIGVLEKLLKLGAKVDAEDRYGRTPLYYGLRANRTKIVTALLAAGASIKVKSKDNGKTLLHAAVSEGRLDIAKYLIRLGAKIDEADHEGITPLYIALALNNSGIISCLIDNGANINFINHKGNSLLQTAVSSSRKDVVELLLSLGSNQSLTDSLGLTPLFRAIKDDNLDIISSLIKDPIILNKKPSKNLGYPIHFAVTNGTYSVVKLLLEKGSSTYLRNSRGLYPVEEAILHNKTDIAALLSQDDITLHSSESFYRRLSKPLHFAVANGDLPAVKCLIDYGALLNISNEDGKLPLTVAVENDDVHLIKLLIANGANLDKTPQGDSLLHVAASKGALESVKLLLKLGLNVEETNLRGLTPLFIATFVNDPTMIRYMVSKGANVNAKLRNGDKPLLKAISNGTLDTVTTLMELGAEVDTNSSRSAIETAVEANRPEIIQILVAKGVSLDRKKSLLHLAAESGSVDAIKTLLVMGTPVDNTSSGYTSLWSATKSNQIGAVEVLLQNGADINQNTQTPFPVRVGNAATWSLLHEAVFKNLVNMTSLLLRHGSDPNSRDFRMWTPLHYAAIMNKLELVQLLLEHGADPKATTSNGLTPLAIVDYNSQLDGKNEIAHLLRSYIGRSDSVSV